MADPLSIAASITGIVAFTAATARNLASVVMEIRDAPDDISILGRDVQSLAAVLSSAQATCAKHDLGREDQALALALAEYLEVCQEAMQGLRLLLKPFASSGGKRSPVRFAIGWTMRKSEVKALRGRLNEGKASLNLTLSAVNGILEGKGQEEIKADINKIYEQLTSEFRNREAGRSVRRRVEDDAISIYTRRNYNPSVPQATDEEFSMRRFIHQPSSSDDPGTQTASGTSHKSLNSPALLSPWSEKPHAILDAVRAQNYDLVQALVSQGAALSVRSTQGYTSLHCCAIANDPRMATLLVESGADINAKDYELRSPLQVALAAEGLDVACVLIKHGCIIGDCVNTLIQLTARNEIAGMKPFVRALQERLASTVKGPFLVHAAISANSAESLETLLKMGFSATSLDDKGFSPLWHALYHNRWRLLKILVRCGADPNEYIQTKTLEDAGEPPSSWYEKQFGTTAPQHTPILLAARNLRSQHALNALLELGADPNQPIGRDNNCIALMAICSPAYSGQAKRLLIAGSKVYPTTHDHRGPMHWAAVCNNIDLMDSLIAHGGDVNYQRKEDGSVVLMIAASNGNAAMTRLLLQHGADASKKLLTGQTALDIAKEKQHGSIINLLEAAAQGAG